MENNNINQQQQQQFVLSRSGSQKNEEFNNLVQCAKPGNNFQKLHRITPKNLENSSIENNNMIMNNSGTSKINVKMLKSSKLQPIVLNQNSIQQPQPLIQQGKRPKIIQKQQVGESEKLPKRDFISHQSNSINKLAKNSTNNSHQKREIPVVSTTDLLNSKRKINSEEAILKFAQKNSLEDIKKLIIQGEGLYIFEIDFQIPNLISLKLPENNLINLFGIAKLASLRSLDLSNNFIQDLSVLKDLSILQKLVLRNNKVLSLKPFKKMKQIQYLDLTGNMLEVFQESVGYLSEIECLQELFLQENPCTTNRYSYKYDLLWNLKLVKLDGEVVTERDYQLSKDFNGQHSNNNNQKRPILQENQQQIQQLDQKKLIRPNTSHGRNDLGGMSNNNTNKFVSGEEGGSLRVQELEKKIMQLEQNLEKQQEQINLNLKEKEELIVENENNYAEIDELYARVQDLEEENEELREGAGQGEEQEDTILDLRRKIAAYESTLIFKDSDRQEMGEQIYHINKQLEDSQFREQKLKEQIEKLENQIQQFKDQLGFK